MKTRFTVLWALMVFTFSMVVASAQTTATNAVALISDNVVNARDTMVPLAIGAAVLVAGIGAAMFFWKRIFRK